VEPLGESLRIRRRLGDTLGVAQCLESIAQATRTSAGPGGCAELFGLASQIREELEAPLPERRRRQMRACFEAAAEELGEEAYREFMARGRALPVEQGVDRALSYCQTAVAH
jgi:hypothetical protein